MAAYLGKERRLVPGHHNPERRVAMQTTTAMQAEQKAYVDRVVHDSNAPRNPGYVEPPVVEQASVDPETIVVSTEWKHYESIDEFIEARPWDSAFPMGDVEVLDVDKANGSPMLGDMIARRIDEPNEVWIIPKDIFMTDYIRYNPHDQETEAGPYTNESWRLNETWKEHRLRKRLARKP